MTPGGQRDYDVRKPLWRKANARVWALARDTIPGSQEQIKENLHFAIRERFGKTSMKDCSARQLHALSDSLEKLKPLTDKKTRERHGRPKRDGVTRMITPEQRSLIRALASELGWSRSLLTSFLQTHFGVDTIDGLATSKMASQAINMLIGFRRKKQSKECNTRYAFG